jgi:hypothetical protein
MGDDVMYYALRFFHVRVAYYNFQSYTEICELSRERWVLSSKGNHVINLKFPGDSSNFESILIISTHDVPEAC